MCIFNLCTVLCAMIHYDNPVFMLIEMSQNV